MPRSRAELSPSEWAVLAILAEGPTHGFAIARQMAPDGEIGKVWSIRRPLVYRALDMLSTRGYAEPAGTAPSQSGPRRTLIRITAPGDAAIATWRLAPVERVRDARSLLLLKLLFLERGDRDPAPLLHAQRATFASHADELSDRGSAVDGFDRVLLRWRYESTTAAIRFIDTLL
jgi:DNA-binding PadR family transcriptional regulator